MQGIRRLDAGGGAQARRGTQLIQRDVDQANAPRFRQHRVIFLRQGLVAEAHRYHQQFVKGQG
ncbi:hypothetical protein D3C83_105120 [compost metagenome]